jgi:C-terminal processing protease CtpA/Prc
MTCTFNIVRRNLGVVSAGLAALISACAVAQVQPQTPPAPSANNAKDSAQDSKSAKGSDKNARNAVKNAKDESSKDPQNAKPSANNAGESANDSLKAARDRTEKAANKPQESARDSAKDAGRDTSHGTREQRNAAGGNGNRPSDREPNTNTNRDLKSRDRDARMRDELDAHNRNSTRDSSRDDRSTSNRNTFRAQEIRSADLGISFARSTREGLVISDLSSTGLIGNVGFRNGDRIVSVNGRAVNQDADFIQFLFADEVRNDRVKVMIVRDGAENVVFVEPARLTAGFRYVENDPLAYIGIVLDERHDDRVVVWKVIPQSPAHYAGIRAGDVVTMLQGTPVGSRRDFVQRVGNLKAGSVPVQVRRDEGVRDFAVDVPRSEARSELRTLRPNIDIQQSK